MSSLLLLKNVTKNFSGVKALDDMHLDLKFGELHAICGENGAGKSTLMKIITGVHQPCHGDIYLKSDKVVMVNPNDAYSKGIAIIYQETSLFPDLTVLENMFMGHEPTKLRLGLFEAIDYNLMRQKAKEIFERLGMEIDLDEMVENLGVATKQMVEIAKALTYEAEVLILDEPTAALTNREVKALFGIIAKLKVEGVSMLYISHRLEEIFEIADRVTVIRDGQYVVTEDVKNVTHEQLVSWMVGREMNDLYPKTKVEIGETVLEVKNLTQAGVLTDINIHLKQGEILGIAGLAGSGRTELAHAISGFSKLDSGNIYLNGDAIHIKNYRHALSKGIVYVSEDRKYNGLVVGMTIKENITMPILAQLSKNSFINFRKEEEISLEYLQKLQIKAPSTDFVVDDLSGGNQQKVAVSKALAANPKILIMDEPTRGVDVGAKAEIHKIISNLAKEGLSIIMISSDLPEIIGMSDRVYVMKNGRIAGEIERSEATQENILSIAL
ncbi:MAG: sugar ABC transporter ATP-binding protein [Vallitaleaceae bacterium]|nr:sugar ABC transporter ATP-binding protein [Vallitaleaceae bacterium]